MKNLRQRMIEDMKLRGLTPGTQATYLEAIEALARHYHRQLIWPGHCSCERSLSGSFTCHCSAFSSLWTFAAGLARLV